MYAYMRLSFIYIYSSVMSLSLIVAAFKKLPCHVFVLCPVCVQASQENIKYRR